VWVLIANGRLGTATDVKNDAGKIGSTHVTARSAGELRDRRKTAATRGQSGVVLSGQLAWSAS
jgi:hypothetical protein